MFFRFHTTSLFVRILINVFVVTLFLDATNIVDLFSHSIIMHGDSDEDAQIVSTSVGLDLHATAKPKSNAPVSRESRNVILDQDSMSLAAEVLPLSVSSFLYSPSNALILSSASREPSPVRLCVLRI